MKYINIYDVSGRESIYIGFITAACDSDNLAITDGFQGSRINTSGSLRYIYNREISAHQGNMESKRELREQFSFNSYRNCVRQVRKFIKIKGFKLIKIERNKTDIFACSVKCRIFYE